EGAQPQGLRVCDSTPTLGLEPVPDSENDHGEEERRHLRVGERVPHRVRIGIANGEPEKERARSQTDERDEDLAAIAGKATHTQSGHFDRGRLERVQRCMPTTTSRGYRRPRSASPT